MSSRRWMHGARSRGSALMLLALTACADLLGIEVYEQSESLLPADGATHIPGGPETGVGPEAGVGPGAGVEAGIPATLRATFDHYPFVRTVAGPYSIRSPGLLQNDTGEGTLSVVAKSGVPTLRGGSVELRADGSFDYFPPSSGFWGDDRFDYDVRDERDESVGARARVRVTLQPDAARLAEIDSGSGNGFKVSAPADGRVESVSGAGDINGDGYADIIVRASQPDAGIATTYAAYVLLGRPLGEGRVNEPPVSLGAIEDGRALIITGLGQSDRVANAGDVNGDALDDLVIGAPEEQLGTGAAYVVFGSASAAGTLSLAEIASEGRGFVMTGSVSGFGAGTSVASAGDVNGDGVGDLIIGSYDSPSGGAYVVFGRSGEQVPVDLSDLAGSTRGFEILGIDDSDYDPTNISVSGAGDINGDGLDDVVIGIEMAGSDPVAYKGYAHVVLGKRDFQRVDLFDLGLSGFAIQGASEADLYGIRVSTAGDVNGDGFGDVNIAIPSGRSRAWDALRVVLGKSGTEAVTLAADGASGIGVFGTGDFESTQLSVSGGGDINGDGVGDIVFAAWEGGGGNAEGNAYVIYGNRSLARVSLSSVGDKGFAIVSANPGDLTGASVASVGDVDGDGLGDVMVVSAGAAYLLLGWDSSDRLGNRDQTWHGTSASDQREYDGTRLISIDGGHGLDTLKLVGDASLDLRALVPNIQGVEVIDLTEGDHDLFLDDAALRRLPDSRAGLSAGLAKTLVVLADSRDRVYLDTGDYIQTAGIGDRDVYRKQGEVYYGVEISSGMTFLPPP